MNTTENNKLIALFMGYYQPKEVQDNLFSFEVYASLENCKEQFPDIEISTYFNDEIENISFVDFPMYHSSWDWLMPVVEKIERLGSCQIDISLNWCRAGYKGRTFDSRDYLKSATKIEAVYNAVIAFINWYNENA